MKRRVNMEQISTPFRYMAVFIVFFYLMILLFLPVCLSRPLTHPVRFAFCLECICLSGWSSTHTQTVYFMASAAAAAQSINFLCSLGSKPLLSCRSKSKVRIHTFTNQTQTCALLGLLCIGASSAVTQVCHEEGKALKLPVMRRSNPHLWS